MSDPAACLNPAALQAIGRSRGGRTTTLHALTDATGRPRVLLIAPGNQHEVMMAAELLSAAGPITHQAR